MADQQTTEVPPGKRGYRPLLATAFDTVIRTYLQDGDTTRGVTAEDCHAAASRIVALRAALQRMANGASVQVAVEALRNDK